MLSTEKKEELKNLPEIECPKVEFEDYVVKEDDTLCKIAYTRKMSLECLRRANNLGTTVFPGQTIKVKKLSVDSISQPEQKLPRVTSCAVARSSLEESKASPKLEPAAQPKKAGSELPGAFQALIDHIKNSCTLRYSAACQSNNREISGSILISPYCVAFDPDLEANEEGLSNTEFLGRYQCFVDMADILKCCVASQSRFSHDPTSYFHLELQLSSVGGKCDEVKVNIDDECVPSDVPVGTVRFKLFCEKELSLIKEQRHEVLFKIAEKIEDYVKRSKKASRKFSATYVPCCEKYSRGRSLSMDSLLSSRPVETYTLNCDYQLELDQSRKSDILTENMVKLLGEKVPPIYKTRKWNIAFNVSEDGVSMRTFYDAVANYNPTIMLVEDNRRNVFGAFVTEKWHECKNYYGTGEAFLFRFDRERNSVMRYRWTGKNFMVMYSFNDELIIGGGTAVGLKVYEDFLLGTTGKCETFRNDLLADGEEFTIAKFEVIGMMQA